MQLCHNCNMVERTRKQEKNDFTETSKYLAKYRSENNFVKK